MRSSAKRNEKLTVDGVKIPFPEKLNCNWFEGSHYFPSPTIDVITKYVKNNYSVKGLREGKSLQYSGHVGSVTE